MYERMYARARACVCVCVCMYAISVDAETTYGVSVNVYPRAKHLCARRFNAFRYEVFDLNV
jgi:hypothetical protein